jgi:hypothetical protein
MGRAQPRGQNASTIQLRDDDYAFLYNLVDSGGVRSISGYGNNQTAGRAWWGSADQPFVRLTPLDFEDGTVNGIRVTSADGHSALPNPRLVSDVIGQQPLDGDGNTISVPNPYGENLFLMSFGQFFDHGLDFYARGGGADLVPIADMNDQIAAAQARLDAIRAAQGLPPVQIDPTDNLLEELQNAPPGFDFLIGSRAGRYELNPDGSVARNPDGTPKLDNAAGTAAVNRTAPFVEQSQTYGSSDAVTYLLRESARDAHGNLISDGQGGWVKTYRLLDGASEVGPDGVSRGDLATYKDVLVNNGVSRSAIDDLLAQVSHGTLSNGDAWTQLKGMAGFVDFNDVGPDHSILLGDKNDGLASPLGPDGQPNASFTLGDLLSYYIAGDHRANENVALTAVHAVWHREANFQAELIHAAHPEWTDDQVFEAAKVIQNAEYQRVVFTEFAEAMSGPIPGPSHGFSGYNPDVNPAISDEFAGAMYRVGHSMINETIPFKDEDGHVQDVPLFDAFLNPAMYAGDDARSGGVGGAAAIIGGELGAAHQRIDTEVVEVIRSKLLGIPLDLYSANIERGRELGISTLNDFRRAISEDGSLLAQAGQNSNYVSVGANQVPTLTPYESWADFGAHLRGTPEEQASLLALFKATYGEDDIHVNDVDLFVGGLAEAPVGASQMGSTFTWIFQEQLDRLQEGDRFYYFNQLKDDPLLLADINSQHFSDIVARNTGLDHLHYSIFKVAEEVDLGARERNRDMSATAVVPDHVYSIVGNDLGNAITGTAGDDTIWGGRGNDRLYGGPGLDALHGESGDDWIEAGSGNRGVFAYGEDGNDVLTGNDGDDNLLGGDGNDLLRGMDGKDFLSGGDGNDLIVAGPGADMIDGGNGVDTLDLKDSDAGVTIDLRTALTPIPGLGGYVQGTVIDNVENVVGTRFDDSLTGDDGANLFDGGFGDDLLDGGGGADLLIGGFGDDTYVIDQPGDCIVELGFGNDTVRVGYGSFYAVGGTIENATYVGDYSGIGQFSLRGTGGANRLEGGDGTDLIDGRGGRDVLIGDGGNDRLIGGNGNDRFVFAAGFGQDRIERFDAKRGGGQDLIDLTAFGIAPGDFAHRVSITDLGRDTLVTIDGNLDQTILLAGLSRASLISQSDFVI